VIYTTGTQYYAYDRATNISTLLNLGTSPIQGGSSDVAHTTTKLWIYNNTGTNIYEFNITLSPFTSVYNRTINVPVGVILGPGLCAIDDTTLLSSNSQNNNKVIKITLNNDNIGQTQPATTTITDLFNLPSGRNISGDLLYTTDGKIILTSQTITAPYYYFIEQYALGTNGIWQQEFEKDITNTALIPYGLATINGGIYIFSVTLIKQISTTFPYNVTIINNVGNPIAGASQVPSCNNVTFQPNIVVASPSPTPTPTKTATPSITVSPSLTPSVTPSPSPPSSNCTGALPLPGGSLVYNGITITASGTGGLALRQNYIASCNITSQTNTIDLGYPGLPFSYTLTFSQPVNNIKLILTAIFGISPNIDSCTFTTSAGTPTILSTDACQVNIAGNTILHLLLSNNVQISLKKYIENTNLNR
jgi:hypothetical protein